ncbi:DUF1569 domain-containing protein [Pedobacter cryophilus]|uniref:DUF1569 domain-containing protein n=1 Tax=Pedobacter cryophilus TaxID=2571271 RepID=A0A4U1BXP5_9SPHI|nr:DUF1569 domain-containing protein [Pedobacter cryophilus]TKB97812.1 DUF1569 domain-containing protein [Pedobacter cryophilus]
MKNVFQLSDKNEILERINKLTPNTQRKWGKMEVAQMLAHLNVSYEMIYEDKHPKPNAFMKLILKLLVKNMVVNEKPYKHNSKTAPAFIIKDDKDFETEKKRLIDFVNKTQELGEAYFDGKESHSFGALNKTEWNNMLYKHLDHHLTQFGV